MTSYDTWLLRRVVAGMPLDGEVEGLSAVPRSMAVHLAGLPPEDRRAAWEAMLAALPNADELVLALAAVDPLAPAPPPPAQAVGFATLADIRRAMTDVRWVWQNWIKSSHVAGIASPEGTGKSRFALDLCRRVWNGMPWPDGQAMTLPVQSPSVWVCADGQHDEIADDAPVFMLPDRAIVFPCLPGEPYGNTCLDDPDALRQIDAAVALCKPWALFVDSLSYATTRDLCEQRTVAILKAPLVELAQKHQIAVVLLLHVSLAGHVLGVRTKGITRQLIHLECPDREHSERLRLWVEKAHGIKPPALGLTMGPGGNDYDCNPPERTDSGGPGKGRPPVKTLRAIAFLVEELSKGDRQGCGARQRVARQGRIEDTDL